MANTPSPHPAGKEPIYCLPAPPSASSLGLFLKRFVIRDGKILWANSPKRFFQPVFVTKQEFQPHLYSVKDGEDKLKEEKTKNVLR